MKNVVIICTIILCILLSLAGVIGCQQQVQPTQQKPALTTKLAIRDIQICSSVSDEGDYVVQPDSTFSLGDVAYVYFEVWGLTMKPVNDKFECWANLSEVALFDPNDDRIAHHLDFIDAHFTDMEEYIDSLWFELHYSSGERDLVGQYRFEFTVKDELSGAIGTGSATFNLE